jgi:protein O-mannosyl-transferase
LKKKNKVKKPSVEVHWFTQHWIYIAIIIGGVIVVFGQTQKFDFTNYDDDQLIVNQAPFLSNPGNIIDAFKRDVFNNPDQPIIFYRPLLTLSFMLDYQISGLTPSAFHLSNVLVHLLCSILVYALCYSLIKNKIISLIGALIFSLHPVQTETVSWLSGRNDLLLGLFTFMMVWCYHLSYVGKRFSKRFYLAFTIVFFTLGLFTKEPIIFFVLLLPLYDLVIRNMAIKDLLQKANIIKYTSLVFVIVLYFLIRYSLFGKILGTGNIYAAKSFWMHLIQSPMVVVSYIQLLIVPYNLSLVHNEPSLSSGVLLRESFSLLLIISLVFLTVKFFRKNKIILFGLLWTLITLIPASNVITIPIPILEHRLYVPIVGLVLIIVGSLKYTLDKVKTRSLYIALSFLLVLLLATVSYNRAQVWENSEKLWLDGIEKTPDDYYPYHLLGEYYLSQNRYEIGLVYLQKSVALNDKDPMLYNNLGYAYIYLKRFQDAVEAYKKAIHLDNKSIKSYIGLGNSLRTLEMYEEADKAYLSGLKIDSMSAMLHYQLGLNYYYQKKLTEAEFHIKKSISQNASGSQEYFTMGSIYYETGKDSSAIYMFEEGLKRGKPNPMVYSVLSNLYRKHGNAEKADRMDKMFEESIHHD